MPVYETTFHVAAAPAQVWRALTDLDAYAEWNPQIPSASGTVAPGEEVALRLALPGRPAMNVTATIERAEPDRELTWRGHVLGAWFFQGFRRFALAPADGGTEVLHREEITGALSPVFGVLMGGPTQRSHDALNEALRARATTST